MRKVLLNFLNSIAWRLQTRSNQSEWEQRLLTVWDFLEGRPELHEKLIIQGGKYNYFPLTDGTYPEIDLCVPQHNFYVIVAPIEAGDWSEARSRGVSRKRWEAGTEQVGTIREGLESLRIVGPLTPVRVWVIDWSHSLDEVSLQEAFTQAFITKPEDEDEQESE